jgi:hypothetical protein
MVGTDKEAFDYRENGKLAINNKRCLHKALQFVLCIMLKFLVLFVFFAVNPSRSIYVDIAACHWYLTFGIPLSLDF